MVLNYKNDANIDQISASLDFADPIERMYSLLDALSSWVKSLPVS